MTDNETSPWRDSRRCKLKKAVVRPFIIRPVLSLHGLLGLWARERSFECVRYSLETMDKRATVREGGGKIKRVIIAAE